MIHGLQALDTSAFYFINHSLANPVFDWLMPILSGGKWFVALAVVTAIFALVKGDTRLRLCILMLAVVLAAGDGLVTNTIKHAVARPRPFVTLPDDRLYGVVGKGHDSPADKIPSPTANLNSMPSSHAANCFAAMMVVFFFYRRSLRFMLPFAITVAFSRVYNGMHYPSDVIAGAIIGAGYGIAITLALEGLWRWIGRRWFPAWHEQFPSLLNPRYRPPENPYLTRAKSEGHWLRLGYILIVAMLVGRWIYLAGGVIELSQDEAYQWTWSKHLDLSYYSKPAGIAVIQFAGTHLFGDTEFGVRFFSPLFAAVTSLILLRFLAREAGVRPSFWLLLAATATPLLGLGTILMTIDPPLVLCWTVAMVAGWRATRPDGTTRDWLVVGLAMGLGFLCKYTAVFEIVCGILFFILAPSARFHLKKPGPYLALMIFALCTLPVICWNAQHHWITLDHVATNAGLKAESAKAIAAAKGHHEWHPFRTFLEFLGAQAGGLNPVFFIGAVWAMIASWRHRHEQPLWLYLFCMGAPVFIGHALYSFHSRILPNWVAPAILPMFCLMVLFWHQKFRDGWRFVKPAFIAGLVLGLFAVAVLYQSKLLGKVVGNPLPAEKDLTRRAMGWTQSAAMVEAERERIATNGRPAFIICGHYGLTGLYSFYLPQARDAVNNAQPMVYPMTSDEARNQFYFWPEYDYRSSRRGQDAIFVSEANLYKLGSDWPWKWLAHKPLTRFSPPLTMLPQRIADQFESVTDLGEQDVKIGNRVYHRIHLWECHGLK